MEIENKLVVVKSGMDWGRGEYKEVANTKNTSEFFCSDGVVLNLDGGGHTNNVHEIQLHRPMCMYTHTEMNVALQNGKNRISSVVWLI